MPSKYYLNKSLSIYMDGSLEQKAYTVCLNMANTC